MPYESITQAIRHASGGEHPAKGAQRKFADEVGASSATVTRWRDGVVPGSEWWPRLADLLDLPEAEVEELATHPRRHDRQSDLTQLSRRLEEALEQVGTNAAALVELKARVEVLESRDSERGDRPDASAGG